MKRTLLPFLAFFPSAFASAQGCSDAGACTAGPLGQIPNASDSSAIVEPRHYARTLVSYAVGEQGVTIVQVQPELSIGLTSRLSAQLKVPYVSTSGNLGGNSGIGDLVLTLSQAVIKERERELSGVLGLRLPTGSTAQVRIDQAVFGPSSHPLPMPYQTGLGTTDLLLGVQYRIRRLTLTGAYQHVLKHDNQNVFLHQFWLDRPEARGYFESYALERADDAVLRVQYALPIQRLTLQPGALAIYHVGQDVSLVNCVPGIYDPQALKRESVKGSEGLTLNLTADARFKLSEHWSVEAMFGTPVVTREARPDGLTRRYVMAAGLRVAF
jgi:hypothetical protein